MMLVVWTMMPPGISPPNQTLKIRTTSIIIYLLKHIKKQSNTIYYNERGRKAKSKKTIGQFGL